jgi:hypothetical protein
MTRTRLFDSLPVGTRFRYVGHAEIFVKLQGHDCGLVARWDGPDADVVTQGIFSFADSAAAARTTEVEVAESDALDARRYRWLREREAWHDITVESNAPGPGDPFHLSGDDLDKAVDAGLKQWPLAE